jgi:ribosomal protein L32
MTHTQTLFSSSLLLFSSALSHKVFTSSTVLFAVPKRRVTHSRKRIKQRFNRTLPLQGSIVYCAETGTPRLPTQISFKLMRSRLSKEKMARLE